MGRPKTVYRGKRKCRWVITLCVMLVAVLIVLAVWLFNYMQRFIVYDKDGLSLVLPFEREETADAPGNDDEEHRGPVPSVDAEIVIDEPGFEDVELGAGQGLEEMHALYVPADSVTAANLAGYASTIPGSDKNALVLQLKTSDGFFHYKSAVALADSYGVNGTEDIGEALFALKEKGVYLVAEISTLHDDAMATRNTPLAMKTSAGAVVTDASGSWLDPYHEGTRSYLVSILEELDALGFDEVLLTGLSFPQADDVVFSQTMTQRPSVVSCVSTFALRMSRAARELELKCSAVCDAARLRAGTSSEIGQDMDLFFRAFDRVYVQTDTEYCAADVRSLGNYAEEDDAARIVPVLAGSAPSSGSWCLR